MSSCRMFCSQAAVVRSGPHVQALTFLLSLSDKFGYCFHIETRAGGLTQIEEHFILQQSSFTCILELTHSSH